MPVSQPARGALGGLAIADTPAMVGDFFDVGGQSVVSAPLIYRFDNVTGTDVGGSFVFDVLPGSNTIDLRTTGSPSGDPAVFDLQQPTNPTDAPLPTDVGFSAADFIGGTATAINPGSPINGDPFNLIYAYDRQIIVPASASANTGRMKIAENVNPIPTDRLFFNYSFFDNVPFVDGISVNRFTTGFEKTFFDRLVSFELRTPVAVTVSSDLIQDEIDINKIEFGDLFMSLKGLLYYDDNVAISGGLSFTAPTADDLRVLTRNRNGSLITLAEVQNESVHILPFLGAMATNGDSFIQGFLQIDIDASGSPVLFNQNANSNLLTLQGELEDVTLMYIDVQAGRWLYRDRSQNAQGFTGAAAITELHVNQSLESQQAVTSDVGFGTFQFGENRSNVTVINAMAGMILEWNRNTTVTTAFATPIGNSTDQQFDGELRVLVNRFL